MYDKLVAVDLAQPRTRITLHGWLDQYINERKGELKPESIRKLEQTKNKLSAHFDAKVELRKVSIQDATDWRKSLKKADLSEAAIKTHCGNAKTMIGEAVHRKLISDNPFALLKSGPTASKYSRYITPNEIDRVVEECPNAEWRLLFGLARYAGLRIPSESHLLAWADVDFDDGRLTVRSPKTEHHDGHEQRMVPITPKLMQLLHERFAEAEEGQQHLVSIKGKGAVLRQVRAICKRAGVEPWKRLWQTLRQSCEKEWAMSFPQYAVSKWVGHSMAVSGKHYANDVPDELFAKASALAKAPRVDTSKGSAGAQRNAQQKLYETNRNNQKRKKGADIASALNSDDFHNLPNISANHCEIKRWSRGESNPRPVIVGMPPLHA